MRVARRLQLWTDMPGSTASPATTIASRHCNSVRSGLPEEYPVGLARSIFRDR